MYCKCGGCAACLEEQGVVERMIDLGGLPVVNLEMNIQPLTVKDLVGPIPEQPETAFGWTADEEP